MLMTTGYDHYDYGISSEKNPVDVLFPFIILILTGLFKPISIITSAAKHTLDLGLTVFITKLGDYKLQGNQSRWLAWDIMPAEQGLESGDCNS